MNNTIFRERVEAQQAKLQEEREWWDRKKATVMKELDGEGSTDKGESTAAQTTTKTAPSEVKTPESSAAPSMTGSDDDAVLVEADQQSANTPGTPGKKKKGKK